MSVTRAAELSSFYDSPQCYLRAIQAARRWPHASVLGIDLAPIPLEATAIPENCRFEIDDMTLGLMHYRNQFDLIHARFIVGGLKQFRRTMDEIHECLKPGGIVIWIDSDYEWFTPDMYVYRTLGSDVDPYGSWISRCVYGE